MSELKYERFNICKKAKKSKIKKGLKKTMIL